MSALRRRSGFSLVELLVVVGVVGLFLSMSVPAIQRFRETAARLQCQSQMRQIGIALHVYHGDHNHLPLERHNTDVRTKDPNFMLSWMTHLLPYIEKDAVYRDAVQTCGTGAMPMQNPPHVGLAQVIKLYCCPIDDRLRGAILDDDGAVVAFASYLGVSGDQDRANGLFGAAPGGPGAAFAVCYDGLSNTLLLGERPPPDTWQAGQWYSALWHMTGKYGQLRGPDHSMRVRQFAYGADDKCASAPDGFRFGPGTTMNPCDRYHFWSLHPGGGNFIFGDASCRFLRYSSDPILPALATRDGGEAVELPD